MGQKDSLQLPGIVGGDDLSLQGGGPLGGLVPSQLLPFATPLSAGVMTKEQAALLNTLATTPAPFPWGITPVFNIDNPKYGGKADAVLNPITAVWTGTDNTPAIQAAVNDMFASGGGIIWIPPGNRRVAGMVNLVATSLVGSAPYQMATIMGAGTSSRLLVDCAGVASLFNVAAWARLSIENLLFWPAQENAAADVGTNVIGFDTCWTTYVKNCIFFSLSSPGAIIGMLDSDLRVEHCSFIKTSAATAVIQANNYDNMIVRESVFGSFYQILGGLTGVKPNAFVAGSAFILFNTPSLFSDQSNALLQPLNVVEKCIFFEANTPPTYSIFFTLSAGGKLYDRINLSDLNIDVAQGATSRAILIQGARKADIERIWSGLASDANKPCIEITNVVDSRVKHCRGVPDASSGTGAVNFQFDGQSLSIEVEDCDFNALTWNNNNAGAFPNVSVIQNGLVSRLRLTSGAIVANTLGKPTAPDGTIGQLGVADDPSLATGVVLDAAAGANAIVRSVERRGQRVQIKSDGAGVLNPGGRYTSSGASAGRIKSAVAPAGIGVTDGTAAAAADTLEQVIF